MFDLLKECYNNKRCLLNAHVNNITDMPSTTHNLSLKAVRNFIAIYQENIRALQALGND